ncbi:unnamed protein product [Allacma fusca]|uniref:Uncharacterized protein n=1 Tax=Allacma fusca TaxID=39272 RepID=A0A8J2NWS6_9HEXA|nr:unnamed protein product [Allacma fusca]
MAEVKEWVSNLAEVEAKLSGFELSIVSQESALAVMLSDCDSLLDRIGMIPHPHPDSGQSINQREDEDEENDEGYLAKLNSECRLLQTQLPPAKPLDDFEKYKDANERKQLRNLLSSFELQNDLSAAGEHYLMSDGEENDAVYLCEFCGEILNSNQLIQQHKNSCIWAF